MYISNCPRCHETFRVPLGDLSQGAQAECPWCAEEFPLAEVLNRLPPVLKIVSTDPTHVGNTGDPSHRQMVDSEAPNVMNLDVQSFALDDDQPAHNETVAFVADTTHSVGKSADHVQSDILVSAAPKVQAKPRAKSRGGLRNLIGVVIVGPLLAALISGGILWSLGKGPFTDLGGAIENSVASTAVDSTDATVNDGAMKPADLSQTNPDQSGRTLPDSDLGATDNLPATTDPPHVEVAVADPQPDTRELNLVVERATKMVNAINGLKADDENRTRWLARAYLEIAKASDLAISDGRSIQSLAQSIKESKILDELETAGSNWMEMGPRNNDGVLIIGTSDGNSVSLSSGKTISISNSDSLPRSGRVMVLGKVSSDDLIKPVWIESLP